MATMKRTARSASTASGPVLVRSRVGGQAILAIQVVDPRYTIQQVIDELNAHELKYAAGQIQRAGRVVARYHIQDKDDYLEHFQIGA